MRAGSRVRRAVLAIGGGALAGCLLGLWLAWEALGEAAVWAVPTVPVRAASRLVSPPPAHEIAGLAWSSSFGLVAALRPAGAPARGAALYALAADSRALVPLALPSDRDCDEVGRDLPTALWDGRLAYRETCFERRRDGRLVQKGAAALLVLSPTDGRAERLQKLQGERDLGVSFSPDARRAIVTNGTELSWLNEKRERVGTRLERVSAASWAPDGRWIAVVGSTHRSASGPMAVPEARAIALIPPSGGEASVVVDGLREAGPPSWSPDGRLLAFGVELLTGRRELWVVAVESRARYRLADAAQFGPTAWSPDGSTLAVMVRDAPPWGGASRTMTASVLLDVPDGLR